MTLLSILTGFHLDERGGERDALGTLLILALIIIPLLLLIIAFGQEIADYAQEKWGEVMGTPVNAG